MGQMIGASPQELRQLGALMRAKGDHLSRAANEISSRLASTQWEGQDGAAFRSAWNGELRAKVGLAAQALEEASKALTRNADEQERASDGLGGGGGGGGLGGGGGGSWGGDGGGGYGGGGGGSWDGDGRDKKSDPAPDGWSNYANWDGHSKGEWKAKAGFQLGEWKIGEVPGDYHKDESKPFEPKFGVEVSGSHKGHWGEAGVSYRGENVDFDAGVYGPYYDVNGKLGLSNKGLDAGLGLGLGLAGASAAVAWDNGPFRAGAKADALLGAHAKGNLKGGAEGVSATGEVFVGGKVKGDVSGGVGPLGLKLTGEGWAGAGASGELKFGIEDGKLKMKGAGGAAWGLGGKLGVEVEVDLKSVVSGIGDFLNPPPPVRGGGGGSW